MYIEVNFSRAQLRRLLLFCVFFPHLVAGRSFELEPLFLNCDSGSRLCLGRMFDQVFHEYCRGFF